MQRVNPWKTLAELLDQLCACYRMQRRPSEKLLDSIAKARKATAELEAEQCTT